MQSHILFFIIITFLPISFINSINARVFTLKMHHRFSEPMKKWSENVNKFTAVDFPAKGSVEYYSQLADHDKIFRRRRLSDSGDERLTFSDGNSSFRISNLGLYVSVLCFVGFNFEFLILGFVKLFTWFIQFLDVELKWWNRNSEFRPRRPKTLFLVELCLLCKRAAA